MITIVPAKDRYFTNFGWLKTFWLFSFSSYYDPGNIQFGALRVFNDDTVAAGTGFATHPHTEMEIVTLVIEGEITHSDSMGNTTVIRAGDVQRMTAGTGLTHSEINRSDKPVHFYQIWLYPDVAGLAPSYDQKSFRPKDWENCLLPVASGQGYPGTVEFHTDATIYRSELTTGKTVKFEGTNGRRIFIYLTRGSLDMNGIGLQENDQARIDTESALILKARKPSELILIDVPSCKGWGLDEAILRGERG